MAQDWLKPETADKFIGQDVLIETKTDKQYIAGTFSRREDGIVFRSSDGLGR